MANNKKRNYSLYIEYQEIFRCPICSDEMSLINDSLVCMNKHSYDMSKSSYINMVSNYRPTKYDKQMFISRKLISELGFFDPLIKNISEVINRNNSSNHPIKILDAGCGEGYHLVKIKERMAGNRENNLLGVGIDISKEGIIIAAKQYSNNIWLVADIANTPFKDKQFDYILNILSPANYIEFSRILADEGLIIKVVPNENYLQELREILYKETRQSSYTNNKTIELFTDNLQLLDRIEINYKVSLDKSNIENLIYMTPLSWGATAENRAEIIKADINEITADFTILVGRKS